MTPLGSDMPDWARQRRPWDIAPSDWRYFVRGGIGILLIVSAITVVVRLIFGQPVDGTVLIVALLITTVLVGSQWFGTIHVTRAIDRLADRMPIAHRSVPRRTLVVGTIAVFVALLVGITAALTASHAFGATTLPRGVAVAVLPALAGTGLLALLGRRTLAILKRPEVVQMLVIDSARAEAYRQHEAHERADLPTDQAIPGPERSGSGPARSVAAITDPVEHRC